MPTPSKYAFKTPRVIAESDPIGYSPYGQIPLDFPATPDTAVPPIGPSGDNTVAPKAGGMKSAPTLPAPAPGRPNAGWMRKHGLA